MSLFPAYAGTSSASSENLPDQSFLSFSSYTIKQPSTSLQTSNENVISTESESSSDSSIEIVKKHRKQKKKRKKTEKVELNINKVRDTDNFIIDKSKVYAFLKVKTIARPARPRYKYSGYRIGLMPPAKRRRHHVRYYNSKYLIAIRREYQRENSDDDGVKDEDREAHGEDDLSRKTAFYNQSLGQDPFDVDLWLEYIRFQDKVWLFEKTYKKGSIAKGSRVTAERKLSILDKALGHNPDSEVLSREKVIIAEHFLPADELSDYLKTFVDKNPGNINFWQGYIEATQCSMSHCTTTAVIEKYNTCLAKLHQLRRNADKAQLEERILTILYQCTLFLRQAGLWEQLWTLVQLYLELNLEKKFEPDIVGCSDRDLLELEEVILDSQLPLHELWLRVEKLRESYHWLPCNTQDSVDPQRLVFVDDVSDLIHPITSNENSFRLTVLILTLLKLPLLPTRHSTLENFRLDYVPWSLDTIESIIPVFYPLYSINLANLHLLKDSAALAVGPQYLKTHPGQEEYLGFLINLIRKCAQSLTGPESIALHVWWLRFERLLIVLDKEKRFKMPAGRVKRIKSNIKEFLKDEQNRNNLIYYTEYALIEYELGNRENSTKILLTAIHQTKQKSIISIENAQERTNLLSLTRTLVELNLNNKTQAITYLLSVITESTNPTPDIIDSSLIKYQHITRELLVQPASITCPEYFLPDYTTDLIICFGWLLCLVESPVKAGTMVEKVMVTLQNSGNDVVWRREVLMEWYVTMLYRACVENEEFGLYALFTDILQRAVEQFPNNLYFMAIVCKEQSTSGCVGQRWWKLSRTLVNCGHAMPALFLVIIANQQLAKMKEEWDEFDIEQPVATLTSYKNRILSIFGRLTRPEMCTKRCGLLWRLYLQYLYIYSDSDACRKAYYAAVEECPWLKALYIDAAIYIPAELPQIQDLIIEKQLRLHVTPEELDVLRT